MSAVRGDVGTGIFSICSIVCIVGRYPKKLLTILNSFPNGPEIGRTDAAIEIGERKIRIRFDRFGEVGESSDALIEIKVGNATVVKCVCVFGIRFNRFCVVSYGGSVLIPVSIVYSTVEKVSDYV